MAELSGAWGGLRAPRRDAAVGHHRGGPLRDHAAAPRGILTTPTYSGRVLANSFTHKESARRPMTRPSFPSGGVTARPVRPAPCNGVTVHRDPPHSTRNSRWDGPFVGSASFDARNPPLAQSRHELSVAPTSLLQPLVKKRFTNLRHLFAVAKSTQRLGRVLVTGLALTQGRTTANLSRTGVTPRATGTPGVHVVTEREEDLTCPRRLTT